MVYTEEHVANMRKVYEEEIANLEEGNDILQEEIKDLKKDKFMFEEMIEKIRDIV